jgi:RNA polymerase sigma-70 factor (ECF subfamily)
MTEHLIRVEGKDDVHNETMKNINLLQQFIHKFKEPDRSLMILYSEDGTYNQISEIPGITLTNIVLKIKRVKDKLKQKFSIYN